MLQQRQLGHEGAHDKIRGRLLHRRPTGCPPGGENELPRMIAKRGVGGADEGDAGVDGALRQVDQRPPLAHQLPGKVIRRAHGGWPAGRRIQRRPDEVKRGVDKVRFRLKFA